MTGMFWFGGGNVAQLLDLAVWNVGGHHALAQDGHGFTEAKYS
jgi:hypothetical protein